MSKRRIALGLTVLAAAASLLAASLPGTATANTAVGAGSATSKTAQVDAGTTKVTPTLTLLGANLGGLAGLVTSNLVNPLLALPQGITAALANSLTGAGLSATSGDTQQPRTASGAYPMCGQGGWTSSNCYGPLLPTISAAGLITLATGGVQGYATGDDKGYAAAAHVANPMLSLFGVPIGDLGVVDSSASCTTTTCTAGHALTAGSLFNGGLTYALASGDILARVGSVVVGSVPITVTPGVTASLSGGLLKVDVSLSLTQLLGGIGTTLSALGSALGGGLTDSGTSITLTLSIGPGQVTTGSGTTASAWGLNVGVSLAADIRLNLGGFNLLGLPINLATVGVSVGPTTAGSPGLTNLKLAYSSATAGTLLPGWVPPALI